MRLDSELTSAYGIATLAPHAITQRVQVAVPATKLGVIDFLSLYIRRVTAAAAVGAVYCEIRRTASVVGRLILESNTVDAERQELFAMQMFLGASEEFSIWTFDGSTGGTVAFHVAIHGRQYNT